MQNQLIKCGKRELEETSRSTHAAGLLSKEELKKAVQGQKKMFPDGIPECGVDALRFTLCSHNIKNHFINFNVQECKTNQLFGNKVWQACKFTAKWCETVTEVRNVRKGEELGKGQQRLGRMDAWILGRLSIMIRTVDESFEMFEFHNATAALKDFLYYDFCDVYLETTKRAFGTPDSHEAETHCWVLTLCLDVCLRALAPFMPYLSQHLHRFLCQNTTLQADNFYPKFPRQTDQDLEINVEKSLTYVKSIRRLKKLFNVTAKHNPEVVLITKEADIFKDFTHTIADLAKCKTFKIHSDYDAINTGTGYVSDTVANNAVIYLRVPEELQKAFDIDADKLNEKRAKLSVALEKLQREIAAPAYKLKMWGEAHEHNLKKITNLEEKIARIDYVQSFTKQ